MTQDPLQEIILSARRSHNAPPQAPHEQLWARIEADRRCHREQLLPVPKHYWRWAIAAMLVCSFGFHFLTNDRPEVRPGLGSGPSFVSTKTDRSSKQPVIEHTNQIYNQFSVAVLDRADAMLTDFCIRIRAEQESVANTSSLAGSLMVETRLLLDSPAGDDPELRQMLIEVELVLAQLSRLSESRNRKDRAWIRTGMEQRNTLGRLRTIASVRNQQLSL